MIFSLTSFKQNLYIIKYTTLFKHCKVIIVTSGDIMEREFKQIGNSWALFFTKTMLQILDINPEKDKVEIEFEKKVLTIKKSDKKM